jgi:hypothetical protein
VLLQQTGTFLYDAYQRQRDYYEELFKLAQSTIFAKNPCLFPPMDFSKEKFFAALSLVQSRAINDSECDGLSLCPLVDLFNHDHTIPDTFACVEVSGEHHFYATR